jgi:prepilin-type N-terminal cleavage/methylation domain-containing protein
MKKKIDRYESMKILKKNEGFSLVELIVVVLIMAIIATALTLAVTKYVARANYPSEHPLTDYTY